MADPLPHSHPELHAPSPAGAGVFSIQPATGEREWCGRSPWAGRPRSSSFHLHPHSFDQNSVSWQYSTTEAIGKCSLSKCPQGRGNGLWRHMEVSAIPVIFSLLCPPGQGGQYYYYYLKYFFWKIMLFLLLLFIFIFWLCRLTCGILVPQPGIGPMPPALEVWGLNHWTIRDVPGEDLLSVGCGGEGAGEGREPRLSSFLLNTIFIVKTVAFELKLWLL